MIGSSTPWHQERTYRFSAHWQAMRRAMIECLIYLRPATHSGNGLHCWQRAS
jgi:hypothetical protein